MRRLLSSSSMDSYITPEEPNTCWGKYWDRATFIINVIQHLYCYFLMYYWWISEPEISRILIALYCSISPMAIIAAIAIIPGMVEDENKRYNCCLLMFLIALSIYQPFFIIFIYLSHINHRWFYATILTSILLNGLPIYLALCYYIVTHPKSTFDASKLEQLLITIYFIIYFLTIVSIYPLFMPLQSINIKHLLFKISAFSLQIIRILFTAFLLVSFYFSDIAVNNVIYYIYYFFLIKMFQITPIFAIWIFFYTFDWVYFDFFKEMIENIYSFTVYQLIFCGMCYFILILVVGLVFLPLLTFGILIIYSIYFWILFECFICDIPQSLIFTDEMRCFGDFEWNQKRFDGWSLLYKYLTDINDNISYNERLCILHYQFMRNSVNICIEQQCRYKNAMECIVTKQKFKHNTVVINEYGIMRLLIKKFLCILISHAKRISFIEDMFPVRSAADLLHYYNFKTKLFFFNWSDIGNIGLEFIGLVIIIPIFIVVNVISIIVCPIVLLIVYFHFFDEQYSNNVMEYIT
eukprot:280946_1